MLQVQKERDAERVVTNIIQNWLEKSVIRSVNVHSAPDYSGEPALFVSVVLKSGKNRLPPEKSVELQIALRDALQDIDDDRFPYVTFSAPDDSVSLPDNDKPT